MTPYETALAHMHETPPNHQAAYASLLRALEEGDYRAAYALGTWYMDGVLVPKSVRKGVALISKAADRGVPEAAYDMGVCCEQGIGRRKSETAALAYFIRAALLEDGDAVIELRRLLHWGSPAVRNRRLAKEFDRNFPPSAVNWKRNDPRE
jgi:uncharacterized protein